MTLGCVLSSLSLGIPSVNCLLYPLHRRVCRACTGEEGEVMQALTQRTVGLHGGLFRKRIVDQMAGGQNLYCPGHTCLAGCPRSKPRYNGIQAVLGTRRPTQGWDWPGSGSWAKRQAPIKKLLHAGLPVGTAWCPGYLHSGPATTPLTHLPLGQG